MACAQMLQFAGFSFRKPRIVTARVVPFRYRNVAARGHGFFFFGPGPYDLDV